MTMVDFMTKNIPVHHTGNACVARTSRTWIHVTLHPQ